MFAGNRNDILAFRETMADFFNFTEYEWAFESSRYFNFRQMLPYKARDSGYVYFNSDELSRRIKEHYGLIS